MSTVLLDSHIIHWWSAEPQRISASARRAISEADELAIADISWFELAWLAKHERIVVSIPVDAWLRQLASQIRTVAVTPAIANAALNLPSSFPGDPADRLIFATAIERGWPLITKDRRLRSHRHPHPVAIW
jgi:PIN domain nuclease of toxin-antitoxin system